MSVEDKLGHHISYEIDMLRGTMDLIGRFPEKSTENNAFIESFCIHARNLIEFFLKKDCCKYTIPDYLPFNGNNALANKFKKKLNIHVSHVIYDGRVTADEGKIGGKDRDEMYEMLRIEIDLFKSKLKDEYSHIKISALPERKVSSAYGATGPTGPCI